MASVVGGGASLTSMLQARPTLVAAECLALIRHRALLLP